MIANANSGWKTREQMEETERAVLPPFASWKLLAAYAFRQRRSRRSELSRACQRAFSAGPVRRWQRIAPGMRFLLKLVARRA
jgi:hypothetical protein